MTEEEHAAAHAREATSVTGWRDLLVLGVTGGIAPCPAGVVLVVYSLTLPDQKLLKAFTYLVSFSLGLGAVLVFIAVGMVLTRSYLVKTTGRTPPAWIQKLPVYTALLISLVGVGLCYQAFDPGFADLRSALFGG